MRTFRQTMSGRCRRPRLGHARYLLLIISTFEMGLAFPAVSLACGGSRVVLDETFKTPNAGWDAPDKYWMYTGKGAVLTLRAPGSYFALNRNYTSEAADICASLVWPGNLKHEDAGHTSSINLLFWAKDYHNFYSFSVYSSGEFYFSRKVIENWRTILHRDAKDVRVVKAKPGDVNELEAQVSGTHVILKINGTQVGETNGQPPPGGGYVGVQMYAGTVAANEDFAVTIPKFQISSYP